MPRQSRVAAVVVLVLGLLGTLVWFVLREGSSEGIASEVESRPDPTAAPSVGSETASPGMSASRSVAEVPAAATSRNAPGVDPLMLTGHVVTREAKPVAGAEVVLSLCDADAFWCIDLEYGKRVERVAAARTDPDGRFAFAVQRARRYRLLVRAAGCSPSESTECVGGQHVVVVVELGLTLAGRVTEKGTDRPIGGARMRAFEPGIATELWRTETDPDGWYRIEGLRAVRHYVEVVTDTHDDGSWGDVTLRADKPNRCDFALSVGETIDGTVTDAASGQAIAGAQVSATWTFGKSVRTDASGHYLLHGAPSSNSSEMHVRAEGHANQMRAVVQTGSRQTQDFALQEGGSVIGRCLDAAGGPVTGVYVAAAGSMSVNPAFIHTDWLPAQSGPDGAFRVSGLAPTPAGPVYTLYFRHAGLGTRIYDLPRALAPGEILDVGEVYLAAGGLIEGRVVDDAGNGVAGIRVGIRGSNTDYRKLCGTARTVPGGTPASGGHPVTQVTDCSIRTRADGWFRFGQLSEGRYVVTIRRPSQTHPEQSKDVALAVGEIRSDLSFVVPAGAKLVVRAVTPQGQPVTGEQFHASVTPQGRYEATWARADQEGRIVLEGLEPGVYRIEFGDEPDDWMMPALEDVTVPREELRVVAKAAAWIEGTVLDKDGKPAIGWWVCGRQHGTPQGSMRNHQSDAEGRFRMKVREGESWDVIVYSRNERSGFEERGHRDGVPAGTKDLVLRP